LIATKKTAASFLCIVLLCCVASSAAGRTIWAYYDSAPGVNTVVVLSNASEFAAADGVTIRLYDANGSLLCESVHGLDAYESTAVFLNGLLDEANELAWGLVEIESELLIQVGVWIGTEEGWLFVENYGELGGSTAGLEVETYWYGVSYANTPNRQTTVTILSPNDRIAFSSLHMYDAVGTLQYYRELPLPVRQPVFIDLADAFPPADDIWGIVDIGTTQPVIVVCTYFDAEGYLIDVDVVDQPYFLQLAETE
jgi:hypothetical protein